MIQESDGHILVRFLSGKDDSAFQEILKRHGPMVMGVCRRILANTHDSEDAFQATFLTLFQKADTIRNLDTLAGWLYQVAFHHAVKLKNKRSRTETLVDEVLSEDPNLDEAKMQEELRVVLDEELNRLSEKYRLPLVLCYLEGESYQEVSNHLGLSHGATKIRLERARAYLRDRLAKRGVALPLGVMATLIAKNASAAVPGHLAHSTFSAVSQFAGNGIVSMKVVSPQVLDLMKSEAAGIKSLLAKGMKITTEATRILVKLSLAGAAGAAVLACMAMYNVQPALNPSKPIPKAEPVSTGLPDLIVSHIGVFPPNPISGTLVFFNVTIQNQGTAAIPKGHVLSVAVSVDGALVSWKYDDSALLFPGEAQIITPDDGPHGSKIWAATPGKHKLVAFVDSQNQIVESDESNNRLGIDLIVGTSSASSLSQQ